MTTPIDSVRDIYAAFARGDMPTVLAALAPNVSWTEAEGFPYGGTFVGPEAVLNGVFRRLGTEWDSFTAVPEEFVAEGEKVVALGLYAGVYKATKRRFAAPYVHVWEFRNGAVVRFRQFTDTAVVQRALVQT